MKTILKIVLAAVVAVTLHVSSTLATTDSKLQDDDPLYRFVTGHSLQGQTRTAQQIEAQNLCPGSEFVCANPEPGNPGEPIMWDGPETKY